MTGLGESRAIGLDIGAGYIAAAQIKRKRGTAFVSGLFYRETGESQENDAALVSALKELGKSRIFSGRRVVLGIPPAEVSTFPIRFGADAGQSVEEALCAEAEKFLPFPAAEAIIDYPSLKESGDSDGKTYKALVAAVRASDIERYMGLLAEAGLSCEAVDLAVSGLVRLHHYLCGPNPNPVVLGHVGRSTSLLAIATRESIAIQRTIDWGSGPLLSRLCEAMDLAEDRQKAAAILRCFGISPEAEAGKDDSDAASVRRVIYQILAPSLDEFVHEMDRAIGYARVEEGSPVFEGVYLYGQTPLASALDAYIEGRLNMATKGIDPLERIPMADAGIPAGIPPDAPVCLALGYAMRRTRWL